MADLSFLKNQKPIAILGLGVSGRAVAQACIDAGVSYHAWVDDPASREKLKNEFTLHDFSGDMSAYSLLIPAAGIKPSHPIIQKAKEQNIPIHSDVDLLLQSAPYATVVGITGTNGKSTTTALIGHILTHAGKNVAIGGNIGRGACSLPSLDKTGIYVLELSSYMLEISANPVADIAVLLNITTDHLDWHGTMEHYTAAKMKIFRQRESKPPQIQIYGQSMEPSMDIPVFGDHEFLKGAHNHENMIVAYQVCTSLGLSDSEIRKHMSTFEGLPHRQKRIAQYRHITFINDSKGTNPDATAKALASFDNMYWILGGQATADKLNGLEQYYPKVRHAYLIGQAAEEFATLLEGKLAYTQCEVLENAVTQAFFDARDDAEPATILLSPACKSWDQYRDYEQRGDEFEAVAQSLVQQESA